MWHAQVKGSNNSYGENGEKNENIDMRLSLSEERLFCLQGEFSLSVASHSLSFSLSLLVCISLFVSLSPSLSIFIYLRNHWMHYAEAFRHIQ